MHRLLVSSTIVGLITMSGLAFTLVAIVIARSPYTHGNLSHEGYNRTEIAYLGEEYPLEGFRLADPRLASTGDPLKDGRALFFRYGCAACHGLKGQGGAVGTKLDPDELSLADLRKDVRGGPKGMPSFTEGILSDEDIDRLYAFLTSLTGAPAVKPGEKATPTPSPTATVGQPTATGAAPTATAAPTGVAPT